MIRNTVLSAGIAIYWPLGLVLICALVLVMIAVLALLLIKGQNDTPATWNILRAVSNKRKKNQHLQNAVMQVRFFRIGRDSDVRKASLLPNQWLSVGAEKKDCFCLDEDDSKLEKIHFRISINGEMLLVAAVNGETFVNGVPIRKLGTVQARSGDLIRAGSHEYRVIFSPGEEKENVT